VNPRKGTHSLQTRLLLLVLSLVSAVWLVATALIWYDAQHEIDELLNSHLAQAAALLVVQQVGNGHGDGEDDSVTTNEAPLLHKYAPKVAFQVFHEGQLVSSSKNVGVEPLSALLRGYSTVHRGHDQTEWRVFAAQGVESDVQVFVGEQTSTRDDILAAVVHGLLMPLLLALPVLALALWWAVRQGLRPLRQLGAAIGARQPNAIEPLALEGTPLEVQALVGALNELFERIGQLIASERRFTADAAHELRTPIAAIRTQAQVALGAGRDDALREHALRYTLAGCDRATRLVEQLLTLARLEAAPVEHSDQVELAALARQVAAALAPAALARGQTLELDAEAHCDVAGNELLLGVLLRNLIDNALRYSPAGATVQVAVRREAGGIVLAVHDSGPGLSDEQMARLGERFFRVLGSDQPGSGLGWSIVRRIAQVHGVELQVCRSSVLGGLAVTMRWQAQSPVGSSADGP
jgi:two-component system sensor histidine kinase QseC